MQISKTLFGEVLQTLGSVSALLLLALFLDSKFFNTFYFSQGQLINNGFVSIVIFYLFSKGTQRVRQQLFNAVIIGVLGACRT